MKNYNNLNIEKLKLYSLREKRRIVKTIFINDDISNDFKKDVKDNIDMDENGFNIEKLYTFDKDGNRQYFNLIRNKFSNFFDRKEIKSENKFIQPKTDISVFEKINNKYIKMGNRNLIEDGHTILVRVHSGQGDLKLDGNLKFIQDVLLSVDYIRQNYRTITIPTNFNGKLKEECLHEYTQARSYNSIVPNHRNLIILYGQKLDTGIDLPEINPDIIINLSKMGSSDVAVQVLGRIERGNPEANKKFCFFYDFNIVNILSSVYSNKIIKKSINEYEFLYEYKDSILNVENFNIVESDDNYIKKLSINVNNELNKENDTESFYNKVTSNIEFDDIYYNSNKEFTSITNDENLDISGKSKSLKEKKLIKTNSVSDETKNEIKAKLKLSHVLPEIFKIYNDLYENDCRNIKEITNLVLSNNEYKNQLFHNFGKMIKELKIEIKDGIENTTDYILNSFDFDLLNNELIFKEKIDPINRSKININTLF